LCYAAYMHYVFTRYETALPFSYCTAIIRECVHIYGLLIAYHKGKCRSLALHCVYLFSDSEAMY
jgi:hypothetical protein